MILKLKELTPSAFARFGQVIDLPARSCDASGPGWTWWGENHLMAGGKGSYAIGYLDLQPGFLHFDWAERHMETDELVIPLAADCAVYAAPPEHLSEPGRLPPMETFKAFRVCLGQAVLFGQGVWHGAPLAIDRPGRAMVLLLHGTGNGDAHVVRFPKEPVRLEA